MYALESWLVSVCPAPSNLPFKLQNSFLQLKGQWSGLFSIHLSYSPINWCSLMTPHWYWKKGTLFYLKYKILHDPASPYFEIPYAPATPSDVWLLNAPGLFTASLCLSTCCSLYRILYLFTCWLWLIVPFSASSRLLREAFTVGNPLLQDGSSACSELFIPCFFLASTSLTAFLSSQ